MERGKLGSPRAPWFHREWGIAETGAEPGSFASDTGNGAWTCKPNHGDGPGSGVLGGLALYLRMRDSIKAEFEETESRGWNRS